MPRHGKLLPGRQRLIGGRKDAKTAGTDGTDLTGRAVSHWNLSAAFWRHGPNMLKQMQQQGIEWPTFRERHMRDLLTYLNSSLSRQDQ